MLRNQLRYLRYYAYVRSKGHIMHGSSLWAGQYHIQEALAKNCFPKLSQQLTVLSMRDFGLDKVPSRYTRNFLGVAFGKTYIHNISTGRILYGIWCAWLVWWWLNVLFKFQLRSWNQTHSLLLKSENQTLKSWSPSCAT